MNDMTMEIDLTIQEVSDRLGLPKSTLRYWEKEFDGFIVPTRTPGGQRRYSEQDMDIITSICKLKQTGLSLTQIKTHLLKKSHQHEKLEPFEIDQLAERISNTVKREIYNYFSKTQYPRNGDKVTGSQ